MTDIWSLVQRIELSSGLNVYVLRAERDVTLIGAGRASDSRELVAELREREIVPSDVTRIVANSWLPDCLGGAREFPRADLLVYSPDLTSPRNWESWLEQRRRLRRDVATALIEHEQRWTASDLKAWIDDAFPRGTSSLEFIPMRTGHRIAAGPLQLDVVDASGLGEGACVLHSAEHDVAFVGALELDGLPIVEGTVRDYLVALDRVVQLSPKWLMGLRGEPTGHGKWTLKRVSRFLGNYLSNASSMLLEERELLHIATADLGHAPERLSDQVEAVLRHRPFLDELVSSGVLGGSGDGISRRYAAL